MNKKITFLVLAAVTALSVTGCGRKIAETVVPTDLSTYLYKNTPNDGIDQTANLEMDAIVGKEVKNDDGTITVPVEATITDLSKYTGQFEVIYEKDENEKDGDGWVVKDVKYLNYPESWVIEPISEIDNDIAKKAIIDRGEILFAGVPEKLTADNVTEVNLEDIHTTEDKNTVTANGTFKVINEIVTYTVTANFEFKHTINGYKIANAFIAGYDVKLNDAYAFTVSDEDLIAILSKSAMRVGEQSVDLAKVTGINQRQDKFDASDLSMTIIAEVAISNDFYDATANIYYIYKLDDKKESWTLDKYLADTFHVTAWKDVKGLYEGKIGKTTVDCDIVEFEQDGSFVAMLMYKDNTEMEIHGRIDMSDLTVEMQEEDGTLKLTGAFSADRGTFTGKYGEGAWYFIDREAYEKYLKDKEANKLADKENADTEKDTEKKDDKKEDTKGDNAKEGV